MALDRLWEEIINMGGAYVIDLDISKYFDTIRSQALAGSGAGTGQRRGDHADDREMVECRGHGTGQAFASRTGGTSRGVISPMLSNVFLHEVLDSWFVEQVRRELIGQPQEGYFCLKEGRSKHV